MSEREHSPQRPWEEVRADLEKIYPVKKAVQDLFKERERRYGIRDETIDTSTSENSNQT